jgi:predicted Zn-dependent protease
VKAAPFSRLLRGLAVGAALSFLAAPHSALGAGGAIRDTEIENDIRTMSASIFRAAGLEPNDVGIYLIQDNQLNSFVAGGQAIFMHTGLILRAETPNQLIGVVAHETGHIAGGHILRAKEAMHNASIESIIATVVGAAASVLARSGAPMLGAAGVGMRSFLQFSIAQEATADHAALNFLDRSFSRSCRATRSCPELVRRPGPTRTR